MNMVTVSPAITPEKIDELMKALAMMGVHVPARDIAFFQSIVCQWLEGLVEVYKPAQARIDQQSLLRDCATELEWCEAHWGSDYSVLLTKIRNALK